VGWDQRSPECLFYTRVEHKKSAAARLDNQCRPQACPVDNNLCPLYSGVSRTTATCTMGGPFRDLPFGDWQGHIAFETRVTLPLSYP